MVRVLWKSEACMVVFKPAGLATQSPAPHPSLEAIIRRDLDRASKSTQYVAFPHRLDRPVSGAILVALTKRAANLLSQQFESRKVQKRYLAWVQGDATGCQPHWQDSIRKLPDEARCEITDSIATDARSAVTTVRVIEKSEWATLLELCPLTGRMHQLRVQCAHRGFPILGDSLYGSTVAFSGNAPDNHDSPEATDEDHNTNNDYPPIALHAWSIEFHDPSNGKRVLVQADPPWQSTSST